LFFILTSLAALFAANADARLFHPELYQQALEEQHFYTNYPSVLAEQFARKANIQTLKNGEPFAVSYSNPSSWRNSRDSNNGPPTAPKMNPPICAI